MREEKTCAELRERVGIEAIGSNLKRQVEVVWSCGEESKRGLG